MTFVFGGASGVAGAYLASIVLAVALHLAVNKV